MGFGITVIGTDEKLYAYRLSSCPWTRIFHEVTIYETQREVIEVVKELNRQGYQKLIIMWSHEIQHALSLGDNAIRGEHGSLYHNL